MADTASVNNVLELSGAHVLDQESLIVSADGIGGDTTDVTDDDILQQALGDASGNLVGHFPSGDESVSVTEDLVQSVADGFDTNDSNGVVNFDAHQYAVVSAEDGQLYEIREPTRNGTLENDVASAEMDDESNKDTIGIENLVDQFSQAQPSEKENIVNRNSLLSHANVKIQPASTQSTPISVRIVTNPNTPAPLGSSQNPIRIIQQGNQYTPVQNLSTEQLSQIMQVVQEQQVTKSAEAQGQSILFNPQTNTRIVYRVIYPSELHKKGNISNNSLNNGQSQGQQTVVLTQSSRRPYKKRKHAEGEEDKMDGPELSKEEKEIKKKQRPRTRSGRVSKPPKHMVKDYKHIHVLDWDEDYDDSDGGYSDYKEAENDSLDTDGQASSVPDNFNVFDVPRSRNWVCGTCHKRYIGRGGLARHLRLYPDHGNPDDLPEEPLPGPEGTNHTNGMGNNIGSMSEDSNTQDSVSGTPPTPSTPTMSSAPRSYRPYRRRGGMRGRPPHHDSLAMEQRRKAKLREIIRQSEDDDLMEVVFPRLAQALSLWEVLVMKTEQGQPPRPHVQDIYAELVALTKKAQTFSKEYLKPVSKEDPVNTKEKLEVDNPDVAAVLGLTVGTYYIDPPEPKPPAFQITTTPSKDSNSNNSTPAFTSFSEASAGCKNNYPTASGSTNVTTPLVANKAPTHVSAGTTIKLLNKLEDKSLHSSSSVSQAHVNPFSNSNLMNANDIMVEGGAAVVTTPSATQADTSIVHMAPILPTSTRLVTSSTKSPSKAGVVKSSPVVIQARGSNGVDSNGVDLESRPLVGGISLLPPNISALRASVNNSETLSNISSNATRVAAQSSHSSSSLSSLSSNSSTAAMMCGVRQSVVHSSTPTIKIHSSSLASSSACAISSNSLQFLPSQILSSGNSQQYFVLTDSGRSSATSAMTSILTIPADSLADSFTVDSIDSLPLSETTNKEADIEDDMQENNSVTFVDNSDMEPNAMTTQGPQDDKAFIEEDSYLVLKGEEREEMQLEDSLLQAEEPTGMLQNDGMEQMEGLEQEQSLGTTGPNIYQTPDGIFIIQQPDGSTLQLQGSDGEPVTLETVQALLAMDGGQFFQTSAVEDTDSVEK